MTDKQLTAFAKSHDIRYCPHPGACAAEHFIPAHCLPKALREQFSTCTKDGIVGFPTELNDHLVEILSGTVAVEVQWAVSIPGEAPVLHESEEDARESAASDRAWCSTAPRTIRCRIAVYTPWKEVTE